MHGIKKYLLDNQTTKFLANSGYVYVIHLLHILLNLIPGFIRKLYSSCC